MNMSHYWDQARADYKRRAVERKERNKKKFDRRGWYQIGCMSPEYRALYGYPRRQAVRYSAAESGDIVAQYLMGFSVSEIAEWHERGENGIYCHLERVIDLSHRN